MNKSSCFLGMFLLALALACLVDHVECGRTVVRNQNSLATRSNLATTSASEDEEEPQQKKQQVQKGTKPKTSSFFAPSLQRLLPQVQRDAMQMMRGFLSGIGWEVSGWELDLFEMVVNRVARQLLNNMQDFI